MGYMNMSQWRRQEWMAVVSWIFLGCLAWLPNAVAEKTGADYFVTSLPGAPEPLLKMHAG